MKRLWWCTVTLLTVAVLPRDSAAENEPLRLSVEHGDEHHEVLLSVENVSKSPVRVYLDRRLARIELRDWERSLGSCRHPAESIAKQPDDRRFVKLEPGQSATEPLDLRFPCFGRSLSRLAKAKLVQLTYQVRHATDRLGRSVWTGRLGPAKSPLISADQQVTPQPTNEIDNEKAPLQLVRVRGLPDVTSGESISVTLELRGPKRGRLPVALRYELFSFEITTPSGQTKFCQLPSSRVTPLREFYSYLGRQQASIEISRVCPSKVFAEQGVYEIRPSFTASYDGREVGLNAWTGVVVGETFLARVRRGGRNAIDPVEVKVPGSAVEGAAEDAR